MASVDMAMAVVTYFAPECACQLFRGGDNAVVEIGGFVALVQRIDCRYETGALTRWAWLHEPERARAIAYEVPVGVREDRALQNRVIVRVLENEIRSAVLRFANDAVVQRVVPTCIDLDGKPAATQRLGELLETLTVPLEDGGAGFRCCGVMRALIAELRRVVAHEQLETRRRLARKPGSSFDRRMKAGRGIDDHEDAFVAAHLAPCSLAAASPLY